MFAGRLAASALCAWLLCSVSATSAHPHSWIDLRVTVEFNDQGKITALHQRWLMDPFASTLWLDGIAGMQGAQRERELEKAAREALERISGHDYFTVIKHGGEKIDQVEAQNPRLKPVKGRLELQFELSLDNPIDPEKASLRYAVFDPTYYVEILHAKSNSIRLDGGGLHCDLHLEPPSPDPQQVAYAASLGRDVQASTELGQNFAEWAEISCAQ